MTIKCNPKQKAFSTLLRLGLVLVPMLLLVGASAAILVCSASAANAQE